MTLLVFHHHGAGDRDSQVHTDYARDTFLLRSKLSNGVIFLKKNMSKHEELNSREVFGVRKIAIVFYLGTDNGLESKGRTHIYKGDRDMFIGKGFRQMYGEIKNSGPIKSIKPVKNRLLAFEVSASSFHSVETNTEPRNTITQWFHVDAELCPNDYAINGN